MLQKEFQFYLKNLPELLCQYSGRFVVIKGEAVIGDYSTELEAYDEASKNHELGTFLIQQVSSEEESYTQTYHSRVVFA